MDNDLLVKLSRKRLPSAQVYEGIHFHVPIESYRKLPRLASIGSSNQCSPLPSLYIVNYKKQIRDNESEWVLDSIEQKR